MKHGLNTDMKFTALPILFSICFSCFADDTNIIFKGDWSEPVGLRNMESGHDHGIRGRLLIIAGSEPAYGGPKTDNAAMMFVELQNVTGAYSESPDVLFDSTKLKCKLTDEYGKDFPNPMSAMAYSGRGALVNWVKLPYNSTIRLFVNSESKSPLSIHPNENHGVNLGQFRPAIQMCIIFLGHLSFARARMVWPKFWAIVCRCHVSRNITRKIA